MRTVRTIVALAALVSNLPAMHALAESGAAAARPAAVVATTAPSVTATHSRQEMAAATRSGANAERTADNADDDFELPLRAAAALLLAGVLAVITLTRRHGGQ